jgi:Zn-dependent protease with chaperone function
MSSTSRARDGLTALLLSLTLTLILAVVYALYPVAAAIFTSVLSRRDGGGIGAVAGGLGESFLWALLLLEPALFLIIFAWLRRRRVRS